MSSRAGGNPGTVRERGLPAAGAPGQPRDVRWMDDFEVIAERRRVAAALAALAGRYRALSCEVSRRETLRWMLVP